MVLIKEYRIPLPLTVEEYQVAQLYSVIDASRTNTSGDAGVEILANEPYENEEHGKGQYTHKIYHMGSRAPRLLSAILPASAFKLVEKAWNSYPNCRTEYSNPLMGDRFSVVIVSKHIPDSGTSENVHGLSPEVLAQRQVQCIDIGRDVAEEGNVNNNPAEFKSVKTGRGPLTEGWTKVSNPIMCCYKLITARFNVFGFQNKVEAIINQYQYKILTNFHRDLFCLIDQWAGLNMRDIREMEEKIKIELDQKLNELDIQSRD